jgi:hypothetical protein
MTLHDYAYTGQEADAGSFTCGPSYLLCNESFMWKLLDANATVAQIIEDKVGLFSVFHASKMMAEDES